MSCDSNRFTIVFNGEVYNFKEIKKRLSLDGVIFKTSSDTEVLLKAYIHFGVKSFSCLMECLRLQFMIILKRN